MTRGRAAIGDACASRQASTAAASATRSRRCDGFDLAIRGGEFIALLGPSGCGKTTALNCLAGLLPLSGGSIWLDDERIDGLPPERRGFGMVFQNYALFPHLSVRRNVAFGLAMHGVAKQRGGDRVEQVLDLVGLSRHADKYPASSRAASSSAWRSPARS